MIHEAEIPEMKNGIALMDHSIRRRRSSKEENENNSRMPVFRINHKGLIIYANKAAFPLLKAWNCNASKVIPVKILESFPMITNLEADEDIVISYDAHKIYFSVIGFKDAGYIGLYGFERQE